jgi:cysteine desulfurase / selenocysteine lyase
MSMSTNITNTSDPVTAGAPALELGRGAAGAQGGEGLAAMGSLLDPAEVERLANEFFSALPGSPVTPAAALSSPPLAAPGAAPAAILLPATELGIPSLPSSPVGAAALAPDNSAAVPAQGAPGSPFTLLDAAKSGPFNGAPSFPADIFALPGVLGALTPQGIPALPAITSVEVDFRGLPSETVGAAALAPENPDAVPAQGVPGPPFTLADQAQPGPLNTPAAFPAPRDMFSLPAVPASPLITAIPSSPSSQPDMPLTEADLRALPASLTGTTALVPQIPGGAPSWPPASGSSADFTDDKAGPLNAPLSFPRTSDMFSLPGVPGVQWLPGVPVVPSSPPTSAPSEADFRAPSAALPGGGAVATKVPGSVSSPAGPITAPPSRQEPLEVRPEVVPSLEISKRPFDPHLIRGDFPILQEKVHGRPLIWLDNAATTQKPNAVIDRVSSFYRHENSNVHRAAHTLAARATDAYESAREKVRRFLNASSPREIVFVRGTTEGINLVAKSWGHRNVEKDDEVVITWLEHHANIVPWQQLCAEKGARLRVAPVDDRGQVILEEYEKLLGPRTRIVALSHVSNALGTITPAREMIAMAHRHGARVLVDGAQSVAHMHEDVQALDCDFFVFSGHKIFGPTGIGAVYGKADILDNTPPWQGGGNMILDVTFETTVYNVAPARFEAGTGNIADAVGLGAALDYLSEIGLENVARHEHTLLTYATAGLATVPGLRIIGTAREKAGVISFVLDEVRTEDVGLALSQEGIAVRAGHHCAQPILRRFGVEGTVRPSLALYNTTEDIDELVAALWRIQAERGHRKP